MSPTAPIPITRKLTRWEEWSGIVYFVATVFGSSILLWQWQAARSTAIPILLGIGLFFDAMSVVAYISTLVTKRYSSGFLGFGFVCFFWAWLSCPAAVLLSTPQSLAVLWLAKLLDLVALFVLSMCFHVPFWFVHRSKQQPQ